MKLFASGTYFRSARTRKANWRVSSTSGGLFGDAAFGHNPSKDGSRAALHFRCTATAQPSAGALHAILQQIVMPPSILQRQIQLQSSASFIEFCQEPHYAIRTPTTFHANTPRISFVMHHFYGFVQSQAFLSLFV